MKYLIVIILCSIFLIGCDPLKLNGKYVTDSEGKIYEVQEKIGDLYWLAELTPDKLKEIQVLTNKE